MIIIQLILNTLNITQLQLAEILNVSRQTVYMWLSGYKISDKHLYKINEMYNIPIDLLKRSQISGYKINQDEQQIILDCLQKNKIIYNNNIIGILLNIINSNNYIKSSNFDFFISSIQSYENIEIINNQEKFENNSKYLIIANYCNNNLLDKTNEIKNIIDNNVTIETAYIIVESNKDEFIIIKIGGKNETTNL